MKPYINTNFWKTTPTEYEESEDEEESMEEEDMNETNEMNQMNNTNYMNNNNINQMNNNTNNNNINNNINNNNKNKTQTQSINPNQMTKLTKIIQNNPSSDSDDEPDEYFKDMFFSESSNDSDSEDSDSDDFTFSKPKGRKLPDPIKRLIGESSMCYVRKEYKKAVDYCTEVIRLAPSVPDSYQTLAMIYLDLNNRKLAEEYFMIAAHITRTDADLWRRLAEMYKEDGDEEQYYY